MEEHFVYPKLKARYFQLGEFSESTKEVWIVCHGYGYLARYFVKKFEDLQSDQRVIIAPEGLNRFYLEGFSGRVGATWMTKENRLVEIENYITYLNEVYIQIPEPEKIRINVLGFSQGSSTVSRWVLHQSIKVDQLVLWAGDFPPDIDKTAAKKRFEKIPLLLVYGDKDPFVNEERLQAISDRINELAANVELLSYPGGHDILPEALQLVLGKINPD